MGILTTLGFIAATTAVSKAASKAAAEERQAEERRLEIEKAKQYAEQQEITKRTLAIEAEKTRRTVAMQEAARQRMALQHEAERQRQLANQQAIERRRKEVADIRQLRIKHPIDYICPCCTAHRIVDRRAGKISCQYCSFVQPLESFHIFVPELDTPPVQKTAPINNNARNNKKAVPLLNKKGGINIWTILSLVFSGMSVLTCGLFVIPELLGAAFGVIPLCQSNDKRSGLDIGLSITGIAVSGVMLLFFIITLTGASSDSATTSSTIETTTSVMRIMYG